MSGCYRCGSDDGNDGRLCPACTMARMEERKQEKRELFRPLDARQASRRSGEDRSIAASRRHKPGMIVFFVVLGGAVILFLIGAVTVGGVDLGGFLKLKPASLSMERVLEMCKAKPPEVHSAPNGKPCQYIEQVCLESPSASRCSELKEEVRMWTLVSGQVTSSPE